MRALNPFRALVIATTVAVVSTLAGAGSGHAADDPEAAAAKKHYEEGTKAFNLGEYPRAITEFKATYNAKPDPLLLYNIAQSYRLQGDAQQALFFYKSFLRNMPSADNRKEVEGRIKTLDKQLAEQKKESAPPPPPPIPILPVNPPAAGGAAPAAQNAPPGPAGGPPPPATPPAVMPPAVVAPPPTQGATDAARPKISPAGHATTSAPTTVPEAPAQVDLTAPAANVDLTSPVQRTEEPARPIYKKWWFWAGSAVAILLVGGAIAAGANKAPTTPLGLFVPTFK